MAIEWEETVETKRKVRLAVDPVGTSSAVNRAATVDDLRRACEAVGLVVETRESMDNWASAVHDAERDRLACLDALSEHVSPDATADTPRMVRPSSVLAGIRSLQGRLRDARSDLRDHDAALEAAERRRSSEVTGLGQQLAEVVAQRDEARKDYHAAVDRALDAHRVLGARHNEGTIDAAKRVVAERDEARGKLDAVSARLAHHLSDGGVLVGSLPLAFKTDLSALDARRAGIRAVTERLRRERCLIARAVAANIDVLVAEDQGGGFLVAAHRAGEDEDVERNVPAAEVPAVLARQLTEVGA